jgi:hypothetical protein
VGGGRLDTTNGRVKAKRRTCLRYTSRSMALVCRNCGSINTDPGGDPRLLRCGVCGMPQLQRILTPQQKAFAGAAAGAAIGAVFAGPPGALIGALIGTVTAGRLLK